MHSQPTKFLVLIVLVACAQKPTAPPAAPQDAQSRYEDAVRVIQQITPADGAVSDFFGQVAAGDVLVIGAKSNDEHGEAAGAAYLYVRDSTGAWHLDSKVIGRDTAARDSFGAATATRGQIVAVGAPLHDGPHGQNSGEVYVFERKASGTWTQTSLTADPTQELAFFGSSVAVVDSQTLLVGARGAGSSHSGAVHVFERRGDQWRQTAQLAPKTPVANEWFGWALATDGKTVVVGANADEVGYPGPGAAYVFDRSVDGRWLEVAKLTAPSPTVSDLFGHSVAVLDDTIVIGAPGYGETGPGSAYVFSRDGGGWRYRARLRAGVLGQGLVPFSACADSVALWGDRVLVGCPGDDVPFVDVGAVHVYRQRGRTWTEVGQLRPPTPKSGAYFGYAIAATSEAIFVGAEHEETGSVYVLR